MRILLLCFFAYFAAASSDLVLELKENDFDQQIRQHDAILVKFYAPWCGHCKRLAPHMKTAAERLALEDPPISLAKVDCTTETGLCSKFDVSGYPTLKLFKKGELAEDYKGGRDADAIYEYMLTKSKPASTELSTIEQLKTVRKPNKPFILTYSPTSDSPLLTAHLAVASSLSGKAIFAHTHEKSLLTSPSDVSVLELHRPELLQTKLEDSMVVYGGEVSEEALKKWLLANGHGLVRYRVPDDPFSNIEGAVVFYHDASLEKYHKGVTYYRNRLIKAMRALGDEMPSLTVVYCYSEPFMNELTDFGASLPTVVIYSDGKRYLLPTYSPEKYTKFLKDYKSGTLKPFIKSEPIPTESSGYAKKIVKLTFDDVVNDPSKDALIVFHAPWCGHCQQFLPEFEKAAERLKDESDIVLASMDATANDVPPPYQVSGFPTIYFASKNGKASPLVYEGGRTADDVVSYVAKHSTDELNGFTREGTAKKSEF